QDIKVLTLRKSLFLNPLYYQPVFTPNMSGRQYEILLRCFKCTTDRDSKDRLSKVHPLLERLLKNILPR
ncbi:hypothetical protein ILUMI_14569, partial [Ignelater luminosus]